MTKKPSRTVNRLHFTDLDPMRFEDLCLAIVFPLHPWIDIRHYGRLGGDGGVDIFARERMEDGSTRTWFVQCRRYAKATKATLRESVDDCLSKTITPPDVLLLVLACDARRDAQEEYMKYASSKGVGTPILWTASLLEARLYAERRDLLFSYFGVSEALQARRNESTILRNIALKKRLRRELLADPKKVDWEKARKHPPDKFRFSEAIIHSVDDTTYPQADDKRTGISSWFKLEIWDFYHNGVEFAFCVDAGVMDAMGRWSLLETNQSFDKSKFKEIRMLRLARVPYRNIVEVDTMGDEYYSGPHFYCRFANGGEPYDGFRWVLLHAEYPWSMDPEKRLTLDTGRAGEPGDG